MICDYIGCRCTDYKLSPFRAMVCGSCGHTKDVHREKSSSSPLGGSTGGGSGSPQQVRAAPPTRAGTPIPLGLMSRHGSPLVQTPEPSLATPAEGGRKRSQSELPPMRPIPPASVAAKAAANRPLPPPREADSAPSGLKISDTSVPLNRSDGSGYRPSIPPARVPSNPPQTPSPSPSRLNDAGSTIARMGGVPLLPFGIGGKAGIKNATMRPFYGHQPPAPEITHSPSTPPSSSTSDVLPPRSRPRIPNHPPPTRPPPDVGRDPSSGSVIVKSTQPVGVAHPPLTKKATSVHALVEWGRLKELKELLYNTSTNSLQAGNSNPSLSGSGGSATSKDDSNAAVHNPAISSLVLSIDERGQTLLHVAATFGHTAIIDYLIREHEHDPNPVDNEMWTPLHCAANSGHLNACYQLIRYGTMVHVPVASQSILLHYLVSKIPLKLASPTLLAAATEPPLDSASGRVFSFTMPGSNVSTSKEGAPSNISPFGNSAAFGPGSNLFLYLRVLTIAMSSFSDVGASQGGLLVNHQNSNKETPLHKFTISWPMKNPDTVSSTDHLCRLFVLRLLLRSGSDPTIRDCSGKTPFDNLSIRGYDAEVSSISQEFGFKKEDTPTSVKLGGGSDSATRSKSKLLKMSSQSLFTSRKMLKKELASVTVEEAKQIEEGLIAKGVYNFQSQSDSELSFSKGQMMVIMDHKSSSEWWLASIDGVKGWVPSKFVQILHSAQQVVAPPAMVPSSSQESGSVVDEDSKKNETVELLQVVMRLLDSIEVDEENFPILEEAKSNLSLAIASAVALEQQASMYWKTKINTIIRVQAQVRGMLARRRFRDILKYIKLPKGPSEELLQTERLYISQLQTLLEKFIRPLIAKGVFKSGDELTSMLGAVEIILETNKTLLKKMEDYYQIPLGQRHKKSTLGAIFNEMAPYFKTYNAYVEKYDPTEFRRLRTKTPALEELCKKFNTEMTPYFIEDYLAKPMQRSLRYSLLLREILKGMSEDHVEYPSLATAVNKWQDLANEWNERRRRVENQHEVVEIQKAVEGLDLTIVAPSRTFVRKGEVTLYASDGPRTVFMYLFNDLLLLANTRSKKKSTAVSYLNACYLQSMTIYDLPDLYDLVNGFQIVFRPQKKARYKFFKSYTIVSKEKKEWINDIQAAMERCKKSERRQSTREGASLMEGAVNLRTFFSWRSRYGVLRNSKLMLYASEKSKLLESIELHSGFCIRGSDENKLSFTLEEHGPSSTPATLLNSSEKPLASYSLKANSPQEYRKWVSSLKETIHSLQQSTPVLDSVLAGK